MTELERTRERVFAYVNMTKAPCKCGHGKHPDHEVNGDPQINMPDRSVRDWAWPAGKCTKCDCKGFRFEWVP